MCARQPAAPRTGPPHSRSPTTRCSPTATRRPWWTARLDRVALPAALRQLGRLSAAARPGRRPLVDPAERVHSSERRYLPGTLVLETVFTTDSGSVRLRDAMAFAPGQRNHDLGHDAPHEVIRSVEGLRAARSSSRWSSRRARVRARAAAVPCRERRWPHVRRTQPHRRERGGADRDRASHDARSLQRGRGRPGGFCHALGSGRAPRRRWATPADEVAERIEDTAERGAHGRQSTTSTRSAHKELVRFSARVLKGSPTARPGRSGRPDDFPSRDRRRGAQLGLPLP